MKEQKLYLFFTIIIIWYRICVKCRKVWHFLKKLFNRVKWREEKSDKPKKIERKSWKPKRKYYVLLLINFTNLETFLSPIYIRYTYIFNSKRVCLISKIFNNIFWRLRSSFFKKSKIWCWGWGWLLSTLNGELSIFIFYTYMCTW